MSKLTSRQDVDFVIFPDFFSIDYSQIMILLHFASLDRFLHHFDVS